MEWKKTKLTRWTSGTFKITEDDSVESEGRPFRLEAPDSFTEFYGTLREAQQVARMQNELIVLREGNAALREQLAQARGIFPSSTVQVTATRQPPFDHAADRMIESALEENTWTDEDKEEEAHAAWVEQQKAEDDGRGIPSVELVGTNGHAPRVFVEAGDEDTPF